jgi:hypothetical protein
LACFGWQRTKPKQSCWRRRNGDSPIVIADSQTAFQVEFAIAEDGPTFTVSKPGQERTVRRFNAGWNYDVKAMAGHLLADFGP